MTENKEFLRRVAIFEDLAEAEMESVAQLFKERTYKRNEVIFLEEDTGKYMGPDRTQAPGKVRESRFHLLFHYEEVRLL